MSINLGMTVVALQEVCDGGTKREEQKEGDGFVRRNDDGET